MMDDDATPLKLMNMNGTELRCFVNVQFEHVWFGPTTMATIEPAILLSSSIQCRNKQTSIERVLEIQFVKAWRKAFFMPFCLDSILLLSTYKIITMHSENWNSKKYFGVLATLPNASKLRFCHF
jgi:hypothetical protein